MNELTKKKGLGAGRNLASEIRAAVLIAAMIVMFVAQVMVSPSILMNGATLYNYIIKLIMSVTSVGFIASAVTLVIITGNNDLSTGAIMTITAIMSCTMSSQYVESMGESGAAVMAIALPLIVGILCGALNGFLVGVLKLNAFVSTMSTMYAFQGLAILYNGGLTAWAKPLPLFSFVGNGRVLGLPFPILLLALSFIVLGFILHKTVFGRKLFAVGGNSLAAHFSGIDSRIIVFLAYVITGLMSGVAGVFVGSWTQTGDMLMGIGKEFNAITSVVLGGATLSGGVGTMGGTIIGVFFMGVLEMFYVQFNVSIMLQWLIKGLLLLLVIYINSLLEASRNRRKS